MIAYGLEPTICSCHLFFFKENFPFSERMLALVARVPHSSMVSNTSHADAQLKLSHLFFSMQTSINPDPNGEKLMAPIVGKNWQGSWYVSADTRKYRHDSHKIGKRVPMPHS